MAAFNHSAKIVSEGRWKPVRERRVRGRQEHVSPTLIGAKDRGPVILLSSHAQPGSSFGFAVSSAITGVVPCRRNDLWRHIKLEIKANIFLLYCYVIVNYVVILFVTTCHQASKWFDTSLEYMHFWSVHIFRPILFCKINVLTLLLS